MASVVATSNNDNKFTQEFEEYRRACRERFQQNVSVPPTVAEESEEDSVKECAAAMDSLDITDAPIDNRIFSVTPAAQPSNVDIRASTGSMPNEVKLNTSVEALKKKTQRRNSLDKVISFCSSVFSKKPDSPETAREKEKLRAERMKAEQDFRMAHFIAELQMSGRSDEEIQMHLFHIRDQSQYVQRNASFADMFRSMHQAFKDEFAARRNTVTVHVATENPFFAAPPAGYSNDLGYSYEDLVALEPVPRGVKNLDHLPIITYNGQEIKSNQTSCAICMTDFEMEENLRELPCSHHFHQDCVDRWLTVGTTCPVCKGEVRCEQ